MNPGQRTIAALLSVIMMALVALVVVITTDEVQAQVTGERSLGCEGCYVAGGATQVMNSGSSSPKWRFWRMDAEGQFDMTLVEFMSVGNCEIVDICHQPDILGF